MEKPEQKNENAPREEDASVKRASEAGAAQAQDAAEKSEAETPADAAAEAPAGTEAPAEEEKGAGAETPAEEPAKPAEPDWKDRFLRTMADFDNFRKRTARDREDIFKQAAADLIKDLLDTVDTLALALSKAPKDDPFAEGVKMTYDKLLKTLEKHGAKPIDSLGQPLDTQFHEAIAQLPSPDVAEGLVMNEVKRGWLLNGKLLRAAQVVVSSGKPAGAPAEKPA